MPALPRSAVLIVNAASGKGAESFEEAKRLLAEAGVVLTEAHGLEDPALMEPTVKQALAAKAPMIIVGGGDGSLSSTVDHFLGSDTVFALLPLGTANSFARTLGIPLDLPGAVEVIARGEPRRIDLGCIDGDYFVNAAAIGLSPMIAESVPPGLKKSLGRVGYALWALRCAARFRPFRLTVEYPTGVKRRVWATETRIANGTHHGGVELIENAELDSGEIIVQAVTRKTVLGLGWSWFAASLKLSARHGTVTEFRGRELRVSTRPRLDISIDGEIAARTPVKVTVASGAILVAAPRPQEAVD